jgi:hypothetical protein
VCVGVVVDAIACVVLLFVCAKVCVCDVRGWVVQRIRVICQIVFNRIEQIGHIIRLQNLPFRTYYAHVCMRPIN